MKKIIFFDTEINPKSEKILDIGALAENGKTFHSNSLQDFAEFLSDAKYICGHNIIKHDLHYLEKHINDSYAGKFLIIDTLYLSPLLFPKKPYHRLVKDEKLQTNELNNPVNDSQKAQELFYDEITAFNNLPEILKQILFILLQNEAEFKHFFVYLSYNKKSEMPLERIIKEYFRDKICSNTDLNNLIQNYPIELAYCLSLINCTDRNSITPPWVLKSYSEIDRIIYLLRDKPCLSGCEYCKEVLDAGKGLNKFFGFNSFRTFEGESLQEDAVNTAIENKSLLAVFPTGGGKSLTFQIPALMSGENSKGLTIIISPLQSLMKDQVDNLEKVGIKSIYGKCRQNSN